MTEKDYNALKEMRAAEDRWVQLWQMHLRPGDWFLSAQGDLLIFNAVLPWPEENGLQPAGLRHYRFVQASSRVVPDGEYGDAHVSRAVCPLTSAQVAHARARGWAGTDAELWLVAASPQRLNQAWYDAQPVAVQRLVDAFPPGSRWLLQGGDSGDFYVPRAWHADGTLALIHFLGEAGMPFWGPDRVEPERLRPAGEAHRAHAEEGEGQSGDEGYARPFTSKERAFLQQLSHSTVWQSLEREPLAVIRDIPLDEDLTDGWRAALELAHMSTRTRDHEAPFTTSFQPILQAFAERVGWNSARVEKTLSRESATPLEEEVWLRWLCWTEYPDDFDAWWANERGA